MKNGLESTGPKIMGMRWVLTTKADGPSKARLVILGYQAWNLVEVQSSAPTSRLPRNLVLTTCANHNFRLRSGDVTSAFLQTQTDMSNEEFYVRAPAELAILFGARPEYPVLPSRWSKPSMVCPMHHVGGTSKSLPHLLDLVGDN